MKAHSSISKSISKTMSKDIVFSDISLKSNKKINYSRGKDALNTVNLEVVGSTPWTDRINTLLTDIFLPKGYPDSVSGDYLEYQIYDTCQAFCSSISGTLTVRAIMEGIGVGSETATPVSAAVTWILKDGTGMLGSILFTWYRGSRFDSDCKKWRLFADVLNDVAMLLEMFIPYIADFSLLLLCVSTTFKALVGTAGSSTRASLLTHQAIKGNIADVSAKDSSQEIFINLFAFVFGIFILQLVTESNQIWALMCTAVMFHLIFNYKAVRSLKMDVFNSERFRLCLRTYLPTSIVPSVAQVNEKESVCLFKGTSDFEVCGFSLVFGSSLEKIIVTQEVTGLQLLTLVTLFQDKKYFILVHNKNKEIYVTFRKTFNNTDVLKAYFHAVLLGVSLSYLQGDESLKIILRARKNSPVYKLKNVLHESSFLTTDSTMTFQEGTILLKAYMTCEDFVNKEFFAFSKACREQGWTLKKQLINIGEWRGDWMQSEEFKEDMMPRRSALRAFGHGKKTSKRKTQGHMFIL